MDDINTSHLKRVIQTQHGVSSSLLRSVQVCRTGGERTDWDGMVHIFQLNGHPNAREAYAWSSGIQGGRQPRFFAVLRSGQIATPMQAVKAASAAIRKWGAKGIGK